MESSARRSRSGSDRTPAGSVLALVMVLLMSSPVQKTFMVTMDGTPQLAEGATTHALAILMQAFVLALLLEQAFALIFKWRLVQEVLVGRAWRDDPPPRALRVWPGRLQ